MRCSQIWNVCSIKGPTTVRILAFETNVSGAGDAAFTEGLLREEAARVWELYQAGLIREIYFRADQQKAVLMLECTSAEDASTLLATLPLVRQNLIHFEVIPLKAYPGFSRLFHAAQ